jgi:hypothetical protein
MKALQFRVNGKVKEKTPTGNLFLLDCVIE